MVDKSQCKLTLISGDRVVVERATNHINIRKLVPAPYRSVQIEFKKIKIQGNNYIYPGDFIPFIPDKLDRELFNISKLVMNGYTDDNLDYIPVLIMCNDTASQGMVSIALENKVAGKHVFSSINGIFVKIDKKDILSFIGVFFSENENGLEGTTLLEEGVKQIKLDEIVTVMT